ncbi:ATP-binding cassette domain-containing protein [Sediminispirochaeta bajacaliforniensis]|uniref:ATP-binding cassette domain-containing protein n=1 Tax=Sediminispirochaeta bajacaliforniensis TaxID=148 RepID=UPI000368FF5B|nr:ATP-binding cassette domain-containing protein [Sediminispirochaeta bajacaliforniensis]
MVFNQLQISALSFSWPGMIEPLFTDLSFSIGAGWTGLVGANGSGKSTILSIIAGENQPDSGSVKAPSRMLLCRQDTAHLPDQADSFFYAFDERSEEIMRRLDIQYEWFFRWDSLSFGERKRVQIGTALYTAPDLLALDEPTNHLDEVSRDRLLAALADYEGIGIIVSHDRYLLDCLCERTLFLRNGTVVLRPGGISIGLEEAAREAEEAKRALTTAQKHMSSLKRDLERRRNLAQGQQKRRSKAGLPIKDHDARFKKNLARLSGKDGTGGKLLRQLDGTLAAASRAEETAKARLDDTTIRKASGLTLGGELSGKDRLFMFGPDELQVGDRQLSYPELELRPGERVAITGANGNGKSTLIHLLVEHFFLANQDERFPWFYRNAVFLPQELSEADRRLCADLVASLDSSERGMLISAVHRLGSEVEGVLHSSLLSPGEARKVIIARASLMETEVLILDEPTNHLDIESILLLEDALKKFSGALLLVSHDQRFREALTDREWKIYQEAPGRLVLSDEP